MWQYFTEQLHICTQKSTTHNEHQRKLNVSENKKTPWALITTVNKRYWIRYFNHLQMEDQELLNKLKKKFTKCKESAAFLNVLTTSQGQMRIPSWKLRPQKKRTVSLYLCMVHCNLNHHLLVWIRKPKTFTHNYYMYSMVICIPVIFQVSAKVCNTAVKFVQNIDYNWMTNGRN